ncbi:Hypothetical protein OINT_1001638 [Brucella intermedia LMG 3301]|uniref:Uncharacterized protein n=1 Tax=Brucella intermedia LMG 3301 TaxID=641118 RepID=C4WFB9_9HYPH|nr:Hypothetical protein OINT_1001638 [Brucella intermedia LMG 3301]
MIGMRNSARKEISFRGNYRTFVAIVAQSNPAHIK